MNFDDVVELQEEHGKTALSAQMVARPRGLMRIVAPLMARTMQRQFTANWDYLRRRLEDRESRTAS